MVRHPHRKRRYPIRRFTLVALTTAALAGCSADSTTDWSHLDEVDWTELDTSSEVTLPVHTDQPPTIVYPTVNNRLHLLRIGRDTTGTLSYWDGGQWVDTDNVVIIPHGWFVGPDLCCDVGEEIWEEQDKLTGDQAP